MTGALPWSQLMKDAKENPAADYTPLPAGDYQTQVSKVEVTKTKAGEVMFKMQAKVLTGPSMNRITFPNIIVPGPTAKPVRAGYFFNDLKACGITQAFIDSQPQVQQIADALLGKYVIVQLEDAIYNGEKRSNVKRLKPASGGAPAGGQSGPPPIPGAQQPPQPPQGQPGPPVPQYGAPQPMQGQPQPVQYQPQPQQAPMQQPQQAPQQYQPQPQAQQPPAAAPQQYQPEPQQYQQPPAQQQPPAAAPDTSWPQEPQQYAPPATPDQAPQQYQQPEQPQQPPQQQEQPAQQPQQQQPQPPQQAPQQPQGQPQFPPSPFGAQ